MNPATVLSSLADAGPIRAAVNAGFHAYARRRVGELDHADPVDLQERTLRDLVREARRTRFGRDHRFGTIATIEASGMHPSSPMTKAVTDSALDGFPGAGGWPVGRYAVGG